MENRGVSRAAFTKGFQIHCPIQPNYHDNPLKYTILQIKKLRPNQSKEFFHDHPALRGRIIFYFKSHLNIWKPEHLQALWWNSNRAIPCLTGKEAALTFKS